MIVPDSAGRRILHVNVDVYVAGVMVLRGSGRLKLVTHAMFLVGVDFGEGIVAAIEDKVAMQAASKGAIDNRVLATLLKPLKPC